VPASATGPIAVQRLDTGSTAPAILLLHGLGGDHTIWNALVPLLSPEFRVIAPDLPGHGRSPTPPDRVTFASLEASVLGLLDELGIEKVHLVGLSAGAFLALRFALDHPERCRSLVSIAGGAQCDNHTRAIGDRWRKTFQESGPDAYVLRLVKDLYYPDWAEAHLEIVDRLREQTAEAEFRAAVQWAGAIRDFDVRREVGRLGLPTLVIHGMDDQVVDVAHARLLRQSIPGAGLRLLAQTGHMVPIERPTETAEAILGLLRQVERASPSSARPRPPTSERLSP
jgi:pimeloyl-ACP methyl ester carboxylesterase